MAETWKPIRGYTGFYEVSDQGNVRRVGGQPLAPRANGVTGYQQVFLSKGGVVRMRYVHLLVAQAFLGPRPSKMHRLDHIDKVRDHNHVENLQWVTARVNTLRALGKLKMKARRR